MKHKHKWVTDGQHANEFCAICFEDSPRWKKIVDSAQKGKRR